MGGGEEEFLGGGVGTNKGQLVTEPDVSLPAYSNLLMTRGIVEQFYNGEK